jgi:hypothetical protein
VAVVRVGVGSVGKGVTCLQSDMHFVMRHSDAFTHVLLLLQFVTNYLKKWME